MINFLDIAPINFRLDKKWTYAKPFSFAQNRSFHLDRPPHKTSNDVNRNPREARRKNMFYVWYVNLDCVHIHTPFSSARSAEKFLYCTINIICSISIYISYTYNYTHLIRAKRGENMKLYYVYHTTSYCVHISLHLFSSAQSAEIKCYVLRTTYRILIHVVYHILYR